MNIENYGWNSRWAAAFARAAGETEMPCRVSAIHRGWLDAESERGTLRLPEPSHEVLSVGDWVSCDAQRERVLRVLPRENQIRRKAPGGGAREQVLAANVDLALLVMGLDGDFNVRRLERYLVQMAESGVRPAVVLNKADLTAEAALRRTQAERVARNCKVLVLSALHDDVPTMLGTLMTRGESVALLGSSGAGKSTLLNALLGQSRQRTNGVREEDSRGRHTTTVRQILRTPQGWLVFDLPGLREVQLWAGVEHLETAFDEIAALAGECRFRDCRHEGEPGCAVSAAVDAERLHSYQRLRREMESLEQRREGALAANTKRRWKAIHKSMREHPKYKR